MKLKLNKILMITSLLLAAIVTISCRTCKCPAYSFMQEIKPESGKKRASVPGNYLVYYKFDNSEFNIKKSI